MAKIMQKIYLTNKFRGSSEGSGCGLWRRILAISLVGFCSLSSSVGADTYIEFSFETAKAFHSRLKSCPVSVRKGRFEALHADNWILFRRTESCSGASASEGGCKTYVVHVSNNNCGYLGRTVGVATQDRDVLSNGLLSGVSRTGMQLIPLMIDVDGRSALFVDRKNDWEIVVIHE